MRKKRDTAESKASKRNVETGRQGNRQQRRRYSAGAEGWTSGVRKMWVKSLVRRGCDGIVAASLFSYKLKLPT